MSPEDSRVVNPRDCRVSGIFVPPRGLAVRGFASILPSGDAQWQGAVARRDSGWKRTFRIVRRTGDAL